MSGNLSNIFGGPWSPPKEIKPDSPETQLRDAMLSAGLSPPNEILFDGKLHRFNSGTKGKAGHDKPGWYVVFSDGIPSGRFGCWRAGVEVTFCADIGRTLTDSEKMVNARRLAEARTIRDADLKRTRDMASDTVEKIWSDGMLATPEHPYLARKGIGLHGARMTGDGRLMLPLYTPDGKLASLQYIDAEGGKLYHSGGQTGGCFWMVGTLDEAGTIFVAEGFATAATINEVTNRPCIVAYSASNLVPVTGTIREKYGASQDIVIVADNDASGTGQKYADQASAKYGARVVMPPSLGDANDYLAEGGNLKILLEPPSGQEIVKKLKIVFGNELGQDYEPPDELVEGLLVAGSTAVIYGDSNSGKTFWALSLAASIATGQPFCGRQVEEGLVVYLACEAPGSIKTRLQAIKAYYGVVLENVAVVPVPLNFYSNEGDSFDVIEAIKEIERERGKKCGAVIGDTLARMSAGANENSGEDMGPVMARFEHVSLATGATMIIIHHNGKDAAKGARGWSGIRAHIDTEIEISEKGGIRSAEVTKQRELPSKGDIIYFKLETVEMGQTKFGKPATTCVAVEDKEAAAEQPRKKPSKHDENLRLMRRAWDMTGQEVRDGHPYLSRSGFKDFLAGNADWKETTIRNKLDSSRKDGLILPMLTANIIEPFEHGWRIIGEPYSGIWMMVKNEGGGKYD